MAQVALRVFISSPSDVKFERDLASRVLMRLQHEFAAWLKLEEYRWEYKPLAADQGPQESLLPPSQTDIVVGILWSRLGTPLPEEVRRHDRHGMGIRGRRLCPPRTIGQGRERRARASGLSQTGAD